ncbi:MAG: glycosyltransferase N-terminal domain-containing protein, partial [Pseudomonadota bacterium]
MTMSLALTAYLGLSHVTGGFARRRLAARVTLGKEDPDRLHERLGQPKLKRPKGRLIWFHAASVGESVALLSVFEALREEQPEDNILLTTGTVTSAEVMANRLPSGVIHQYVPVDTAAAVKGFLDHWQPDLA